MEKKNIKKGLMLFVFFFKIGCFTFGGGWSILAQMEQEFVDRKHLVTKDELLELVAVGKSVPGIMITNISMLFGYHVGGLFGGVCAVLGMTCPAVLILSLVTCFYNAMKEFNIQKYDRRRPIVIYGASTYGTYVWQALKKNGIEPECFCDKKKAGERYHDKPVYTYEYILKLKNPVVLIAVGAAFNEVCEFLKSKEIIDVYSIYEFVFEDTCFEKQELIGLGKDRDYYKKLYQFGMEYKVDDEKIRIHTLDWVITEKCSLKCRDCSNLMQYYKKPENIYIEQLKDEMYNLLKVVDEIMDLRIIGGEPFMHTEMFNIIREFLLCEQIKNVSISLSIKHF